ncbi:MULTISPECIES: FISUMP domain-containing protein [unclassified Sphingobacterium]|uniref:FISUMP domain-containing protein n=1 Tax=unclassified Sphingobacterium TaxID=2609468 RepID=UPI0010483045|nr:MULTISPECIES: FISUMP domain-containing protein [unclassified Sphingobacterium]MCS3556140.1 uncharacterized protein (TIGR02145 family) [Sphingobacterium sp. JUb21]TCR08516.1 uncharacterized protein (TIGR02145 family) [Sphingobacterium sp. JUb20]
MKETLKNRQLIELCRSRMSNLFSTLSILTLLLLISSCSKNEAEGGLGMGKTTMNVSVASDKFEAAKDIQIKASTPKKGVNTVSTVQRKLVALNDEFTLSAELSVVQSDSLPNTQRSLIGSTKAASETNDVNSGVKYKVAVYDADEKYLTERDYVRGQESSTAELTLESGKTYTFVVYSLNSASSLPAITFADPTSKTLATSSITGINGNTDLMYFNTTKVLTSGATNYLSIVFAHKFSQINVSMDATATGYNITALTSNFNSHYATANINLADGSLTRSGTAQNVNLTFSGFGTKIVTATPVSLNTETTTGSFVISNLTIGPLNQSIPADAISDLEIMPGVKYNLSLTINPKDIYLTHNGQLAARINGDIWMRSNLGAGTTRDPDVTPYISDQHGYYYQWGKKPAVAARAANTVNTSWSATPAAGNPWNSGTQAAPVKNTTSDPCPAGFRVPTAAEYQNLINWTIQTNSGSFTNSSTNFNGLKVFTSKRNANVKLIFPFQGYFTYTTSGSSYRASGITDRGSYGSAWVSDRVNNTFRYLRMTSTSVTVGSNGPNAALALQATCLRCIAE